MLADPVDLTEPPRSEWVLSDLGEGLAWKALEGIDDATVGPGGLSGTVTTPTPVVVLQSRNTMGDGDQIHAIEVRMKVSAGENLGLTVLGPQRPPAVVFGREDGPTLAVSTPLLPGDEMATYRIELDHSMIFGVFVGIDPSRVVIRPSDTPGATFEIESVRLVFRREHLARVPSGLGWQGLGDVWRETLVTRPSERLTVPVTVPEKRPVLDVSMGMPMNEPMRFRLALQPKRGEAQTLIQRTITDPETWQDERIDLAPWAGQDVELVMTTEADSSSSVGFWGSTTLRSQRPARTADGKRPGHDGRPQAVILIIADTLRRDHLDSWRYGRQTAPQLASLAEGGVRFADAVAQAPWTKSSVPSILSSRYPTSHGVFGLEDRLPASAVTVAEAFREAGYATMATSAWSFTGQMTNLHQGVEVMYEGGSVRLPMDMGHTKTARFFTDRVLEFAERHQDDPFFVMMHTGDPHSPYKPAASYANLWTEEGGEEWYDESLRQAFPHIEDPFFRNVRLPTADDLGRAGVSVERWRDHEIGWYDGSIRGLDTEVGRLVEGLERLGLTDDVVIAFVADHGEEFFEHGYNWHGQNLYGHQTDVPLLLWGPGFVPEGVTVDAPVATIDVVPTLLSLAGLERPETTQGRDLTPLVDATAAGDDPSSRNFRVEPVFSERRDIAGLGRNPQGLLPESWSVVTSDWRLIQNPGAPEGVPEFELFDRRTDPLSLDDVAADHPDVVDRLAQNLANWRGYVDKNQLDADASSEMSAEDLERLRSLGYL
jgi:arylsulfatase A-like enzyme